MLALYYLLSIFIQVLATTFDGASVNRRFVAIHDTKSPLVYKLKNLHAEEDRFIYCFSDPPHLIKTVRNCWASKNRFLWVSLIIQTTIIIMLFTVKIIIS